VQKGNPSLGNFYVGGDVDSRRYIGWIGRKHFVGIASMVRTDPEALTWFGELSPRKLSSAFDPVLSVL